MRVITVSEMLADHGHDAFVARPELDEHLGLATIRALQADSKRTAIIDRSLERRTLSAEHLLIGSLAMADRWRDAIPEQRVGIVFPPGIGGFVANLAVILAGKTPVNLNYTLGPEAVESCMDQAGIKTIISTEIVRKKIPGIPWPEEIIDVLKERESLGMIKLMRWAAKVKLDSPESLAEEIDLDVSTGKGREAGILFSSGSTGAPKGVILSHRNVLSNVEQVAAAGLFSTEYPMLGCLPIFHSFGFTITMWMPILKGIQVATVPSPLEFKKIAQVIQEEKLRILIGTPTFFRPYLAKIEPELLETLEFVVAGAEKTPEGMQQKWQDKFGCEYLEGYGITETSPVIGVNLPARLKTDDRPVRKDGSIGPILPGLQVKVTDPETGAAIPVTQTGVIAFKGPNIFEGYLNKPELTAEVIKDGWYTSGDLGHVDADGFLFIDGRLSRFSKVGGEMVPHGTVEQAITKAYGLEDEAEIQVAVAGVRDEAKGEVLVLLSTFAIEANDLRDKLTAAGLANLWIPKRIKQVEKIPVLGTGKLDLKGIVSLAAG